MHKEFMRSNLFEQDLELDIINKLLTYGLTNSGKSYFFVVTSM